MSTPQIYSYSRISTAKQLTGSGLDLQREQSILNDLSTKHQLPISDVAYSDVASAYHGKNLEGELGVFLQAIKDGTIAKGSIIVVYSLDRLSRLQLGYAKQIYLDLTNAGINIYSMLDTHLYQAHNVGDEILSSIIFERSHNESATKSARVVGSTLKRITEHNEGKRSEDGYAIAIKSVAAKHAFMFDVTDGTVRPHAMYFEAARELIQLLITGHSPAEVKKVLDSKYPAPNSVNWQVNLIRKLHKETYLTGDRLLSVHGKEYLLKGYYPVVLTDVELYQLRQAREGKAIPALPLVNVRLLTGMRKAYCSCCHGSMGSTVNSKAVTSYYCNDAKKRQAKNNCKGWSCKTIYIDQAVVNVCTDVIGAQTNTEDTTNELARIEHSITEKTTKLNQLNNVLMSGGDLPMIVLTGMATLESDITKLTGELTALKSKVEVDTDSLAAQWKHIRTIPDEYDHEPRKVLKELIRRSVDRVTITKHEAYSDITITVKLVNGHERSVRCIRGVLGITEVSTLPVGYIGSYEHEGMLDDVPAGITSVDTESPLFK